MALTHYFGIAFATAGDKLAIPDSAAAAGPVSNTYGYGADYSLNPLTDPAALNVERTKMNGLMYNITGSIQQLQQLGNPYFISTTDNGGTPFPYALNAVVRYNDAGVESNYVSLIGSNTNLPTDTAHWLKLRTDYAAVGMANVFTLQQTISSAGTPLVINSTDSTVLKMLFKDAGTIRGAIGASSSYAMAFYLSDAATVAGGWDVSGNLIPGAAATYDLGTSSNQYRAVYANRLQVMGSTMPANGFYLSAANTVGVAANSTLVGTFSSTGLNSTIIGATTAAAATFTTMTANNLNVVSSNIPTNGLYLPSGSIPAIAVAGALAVTFGAGLIGANLTQRHIIPAVASDTIGLLAATQTFSNKAIDATCSVAGFRILSTQAASYTFAAGDAGGCLMTTSASNNTLSIPTNASVPFKLYTEIDVIQYGTGQATIAPASGVTLRTKYGYTKITAQYSGFTLKKIGTDEWVAVGDFTA